MLKAAAHAAWLAEVDELIAGTESRDYFDEEERFLDGFEEASWHFHVPNGLGPL